MSTFHEPKLKYDKRTGEGTVTFPKDWASCDPDWKLDCLRDWTTLLNEEFNRVQTKRRREFKGEQLK
jgi:hypothetical protein